MTYNIPGVFTSVIDRSYIQPLIVEGRSVLIAGFSKYGEDKFYNFADAETMEFTLGEMDIRRYGKGLMYGLGALTKTRNVIFKRLMPDDATYANLIYKTDGTTETKPNLVDPEVLKAEIDQDPGVTIPPVLPKEIEVKSFDGQSSLYFEYNPLNITVYLSGTELNSSEYIAANGREIVFTPEIDHEGKIINAYTVLTHFEAGIGNPIRWVKHEHRETTQGNTVINVPGGYNPEYIYVTINGYEINNAEFSIESYDPNGNPPENITLNLPNGLNVDDVVIVHSVFDEFENEDGEKTSYNIFEYTAVQDDVSTIVVPGGYNPDYTVVLNDGIVLGKGDYSAIDGETITLSDPLMQGEVLRLRSIEPADFSHIYGALIAKGPGEGYNDLYVQFRPAYDVEKVHSDEEGDAKYKFNFLKATVFEQNTTGQRRVSDEFTVSLIDVDPVSRMPIISNITGEALYINDKFGENNEFLDYYLNESFLPQFYEQLSIDDVTKDIHGTPGALRFILIDDDPSRIGGPRNVEVVINREGKFEKKSTIQQGKDKIYTYWNDPDTGDRKVVSISMNDGQLLISESSAANGIADPLYLDGVQAFFEAYIVKRNPTEVGQPLTGDLAIFHKNTSFLITPTPDTTNHRWRLYNLLIGGFGNAVWQMQSGTNGDNLIIDGRLNLGYVAGNLFRQDAKQLLIDFYNNNEVIHEVLYPELDFDYVPDWTGDIDVMNSILQMADEIGFTMPILALPRQNAAEKDYTARIEDVYFSSFNTALYSGQWNDNHFMEKMGTRISVSPSYYAMLNHLQTDESISITEPMANIVKGQLPAAGAQLSYIAKSYDIEKLRGVQINTIIKEIDGIYFIDQLTAYKSASKLSRINVVKVIHRMRKDLPKILKDLLQRKALENILLSAKTRTEKYMSRWQVTDNNTIDGIFTEINVTPLFVEEELKLIVSIAVRPIGTIEKIEVPITVY